MEGAPERISLASVLEWDCYRVLAYFAFFRYPLTAPEVWKWLYAPEGRWTLAEVMETLAHSTWLAEHVTQHHGFYALGDDCAGQVRDRHMRFLDALRKYQTLRPVLGYLGRLPFVRAVAVCNSLAFHHTNEESDIDLFIVTEPGRVWSARLLAVSAMALLRRRPGEAKRDPVCCSFFVDYNAVDLSAVKIGEYDPYLALWTSTLIPVLDRGNVFTRLRVMNTWVDDVLPNARPVCRAPRFRPKTGRQLPGDVMREHIARSIQEAKFPVTIRDLQNKDTRVVVSDRMLKFHVNDRRSEIMAALEEKLCVF